MPTPTQLLEEAAVALRPLLGQLVFVGGATVELLLTDEASAPVRVTKDVDVATRVEKRSELSQLEEQMTKLGFQPDMFGPICRWVKGDLTVDLMTDDGAMQGFTNPWYSSAIEHAMPYTLPSGTEILVLDAVHLVATKLVAWDSRGQRSLYASHDLEDVLLVMDGRPELTEELKAAPPELREFVVTELEYLLSEPGFEDILEGTLEDAGRAELVLERIKEMTAKG